MPSGGGVAAGADEGNARGVRFGLLQQLPPQQPQVRTAERGKAWAGAAERDVAPRRTTE